MTNESTGIEQEIEKECPLNKWESIDYSYKKRECIQERCAWWLARGEVCAIVGLAGILEGVLTVRRVE